MNIIETERLTKTYRRFKNKKELALLAHDHGILAFELVLQVIGVEAHDMDPPGGGRDEPPTRSAGS